MKRIMSLFLAVLLLCGLLFSAIPANAAADEVETVPVHIFDQDDNEVWSGNAPKGEAMTAWLDANAASHVAKEGFTADKWYNKDSGAKLDATATFNGWTNILIKYEEAVQDEEPEEEEQETETVPVHVFDQDGTEIWSGNAPKGGEVTVWLDANAASHVAKEGFTADKWYNKDSGSKFDTTATFNGWTNVLVKYQAVQTPEPEQPPVPEKSVVVTFRLPGGKTTTWSYKPSDYATADNDGTPNWTEGAAEWAMGEAVKKGKLSKSYDNAVLKSVGDNGYAATIELSDNANTETTPPATTKKITVTIKIGTTTKVNAEKVTLESVTVDNLIKRWNKSWADTYYMTNYKIGNTTGTNVDDVIYAGQSVTINLAKREKDVLTDKLSDLKPVVLHVYLNNNFNAEDNHYTITSIAADGTLDLNKDVKEFLLKYYTAKTSDGITYDGMYVADGYFGVKYLADEKYVVLGNDADETGNTTLDYMRSKGYVHLNVMLKNAKAKTSSVASDCPKTGDNIGIFAVTMMVSAIGLSAVLLLNKKAKKLALRQR